MAIAEDNMREMVKAGVHIGHRRARRHPRMLGYIFGLRGNTEIIDVSKTVEAIDKAAEFLKDTAASGKVILFVGTRPILANVTRETAQKLTQPYVTSRWIGGTLTNFAVISKRLDGFRDLVEKEASGELADKYTKAEHVRFQRKIAKLQEEIGGIKEMSKMPDVLVISSLRSNKIAALEAARKGIPAVAIVDTDCDPTLVPYPIPANDDALPSVELILEKLAGAISEGQAKAQEAAKAAAIAKESEVVAEEKKAIDEKKTEALKSEKKTGEAEDKK